MLSTTSFKNNYMSFYKDTYMYKHNNAFKTINLINLQESIIVIDFFDFEVIWAITNYPENERALKSMSNAK